MADGDFAPSSNGDQGTGAPGSKLTNVVLMPDPSKPNYTTGRGVTYANAAKGVQEAQAHYGLMSLAEQKRLKGLWEAVGKNLGYRTPRSFWNEIVTASVNSGMTPWQAMEKAKAEGVGATPDPATAKAAPKGPYVGPTSSSNVTLSNPGDAKALVNNALSTYLGRDATEKEQAAFYAQLTAAQAANPQQSVGTTDGVNHSSTGVDSGGVNKEQMAKDFAQSRPGYSEYQGATTYLDAFIKTLKNPVGTL